MPRRKSVLFTRLSFSLLFSYFPSTSFIIIRSSLSNLQRTKSARFLVANIRSQCGPMIVLSSFFLLRSLKMKRRSRMFFFTRDDDFTGQTESNRPTRQGTRYAQLCAIKRASRAKWISSFDNSACIVCISRSSLIFSRQISNRTTPKNQ
jgi:hypothetical protein